MVKLMGRKIAGQGWKVLSKNLQIYIRTYMHYITLHYITLVGDLFFNGLQKCVTQLPNINFLVEWRDPIPTIYTSGTVDGRNPAPVEVGSLSHYLRQVLYIPGGDRRISSINSSRAPEIMCIRGFRPALQSGVCKVFLLMDGCHF